MIEGYEMGYKIHIVYIAIGVILFLAGKYIFPGAQSISFISLFGVFCLR